ncbi:EF-hand domain-containing protein [Pseudodesulfovibrio piezophilus]|uniref:EF-hand domain-containing protein n=1 Tax=Pseudodesulfovibrio piezophilus (strain DSM 21447 / JCM 15486 / C1TLV30) TaxID=1322246 RepID=M1WK80_PSEP2|nr:hypothetical protein [Pseudodesulfovibrio piezophilus]CCH49136.1 conserved exported protein of unknown function [Pseudodesulfovibrio piezophilus C1TLV30]
MKRIFLAVTIVMNLVLAGSTAFAQVPELRGTWRGSTRIQTLETVVESTCALVINVQNGNTFTGYKLYFNKWKVLVREPLVGLYENGKIYIAEHENENGFGALTGKQSMTITYLDHSASPRVQVCTLERLHFTTGFVEIDKDGDREIVSAEIINHYPLNAERIIGEADADHDGKLTMKEWEKWKNANDWE